MPKETWLADLEPTVDWPIAGLPSSLHLGDGKEFQSAALLRACQEYGMDLEYRPPGRPHYGGHIERLIGTTMGAVHLLPGTTFSNVVEKGEYDAEGQAAMTLLELQRWLALQIGGVYHHSLHSSLGCPPLVAWTERVDKRSLPLRQPASVEQFLLEFLPGEKRTLQRDGFRLFNLRYWDNILSSLVGRSKETWLIKYDPRNLSRVYLQDRHGSFWPIPFRDLGHPPVTLWELQEAQRRLREKGRHAVDESTIFQAVREQRQLVEQSRRTTRDRRRKARHFSASAAQNAQPGVSGTQPVIAVEPFAVEEWA